MELRLLSSFALALFVAGALTPVARRAALACGLLDRPGGWKTHMHPTPFLGGAAVLAGVTTASLLAPDRRTVALLLGAGVILSLVGTIDDARHVDVRWRLLIELSVGCFLWACDLGWQLGAPEAVNLALTSLWVLTVINAFNIIDLMDSVATSILIASAIGVAVLAQLGGETTAAVMSISIVGAALGFLPFNNKPSRIFLGDGGTMALGFLVAALVILAVDGAADDARLLVVAPLLFAIPLIDAVWRAYRRIKRGVSIMTAGHDSLANHVQRQVFTPGRVALVLAGGQAVFSGVAVISIRSGAIATGLATIMIVSASLFLALWSVSSSSLLRRVGALLSRE